MLDLLDRINIYLNNGSNGGVNRELAMYVRDHFEEVVDMSVGELAHACFVSQPTASRFIKSLGYENFAHFKDECRFCMRYRLEKPKERHVGMAMECEDPKRAGRQFVRGCAASMMRLVEELDDAAVERLAHDMAKAEKIYAMGMSYSQLVAEHLQMELAFSFKPVELLSGTSGTERAAELGEGDVLILISLYGTIFERVPDIMRNVQANHAKNWLVTMRDQTSERQDRTERREVFLPRGDSLLANRYVLELFSDILLSHYERQLLEDSVRS